MSRDTPPPPLSLDRGQARGEEASWDTHQVHPKTPHPPSYAAHLKGGKKKRRKSQAAELPKEFSCGEKPTEPERRDFLRSLYERFFAKSSHCAEDQFTQKSQVMSLVQILPLHLAQVGWGSLSKEDRNAPHFRLPTPGYSLNSLDISE